MGSSRIVVISQDTTMEWLAKRQDLSGEAPGDEIQDAALALQNTIQVDHLTQKDVFDNVDNKFSLSSSGAVGIVCPDGRPSLSVFYPGSSRPPQVLTTKGSYWSAVFMMNLNKEYLAATCCDDNTIQLWNLDDNTSSIVYKQKSDKKEAMNMCVIDDRTVAFGEYEPSGKDRTQRFIS